MINFGERLLVVFSKLFAVRNKAPVKFEIPVFVKGAQRNAGIVLHDEVAVLEQKIPDSGEAIIVHEVRRRLNQTDPGAAGRAPTKKRAVAARQIGLEVIQCLRATISTECNFHAFRRAVNVSRVEHGAAEPCEKNIKNRDRSREIAATKLGLHLLGYEIMSDEQCAHRVAQRSEIW